MGVEVQQGGGVRRAVTAGGTAGGGVPTAQAHQFAGPAGMPCPELRVQTHAGWRQLPRAGPAQHSTDLGVAG